MLIFNFHHVEKDILHPDRKHITITPEGLRRFIRTLRAVGMEIVSMRDILQKPDPAAGSNRQVLLTFDDGYVNNAEYAVPVLESERCPATIFVLPGRFSGTNAWDQGHLPEAERDQVMSVEQMQALCQSKYVTFGSHGMLHQDLTTLNADELQFELHESHRILTETLGDAYLPVFAYPWGHYSPDVVAAMEATPYRYAFTVETAPWQSGQPRFQIPRYSAYYRDGNPFIFLAKLCRHGVLFV
jgi:peptidoglycan/xylan/chitin deacetylase (PgdA/CDA1 family)